MDGFYPVVSFLAFVSGGCFGWYYAWRSGRRRVAPERIVHERAADEPALAEAA